MLVLLNNLFFLPKALLLCDGLELVHFFHPQLGGLLF